MYYFASDVHLGHGSATESAAREARFVSWLEMVSADAKAIFLVGDIFDFWFEYRRVVPKGFVRTLGKLAELTGRGIKIHFLAGNHDMWTYGYLEQECGITVHREAFETVLEGKHVYMAHGHTLGRRPWLQRFMTAVFRSECIRRGFVFLVHPNVAMRFGHWWSGSSRKAKSVSHVFRGEDEPLMGFARKYLASHPETDLFVFGHIHVPVRQKLGPHTEVAFLGEWFENPVYGVLGKEGFTLKKY